MWAKGELKCPILALIFSSSLIVEINFIRLSQINLVIVLWDHAFMFKNRWWYYTFLSMLVLFPSCLICSIVLWWSYSVLFLDKISLSNLFAQAHISWSVLFKKLLFCEGFWPAAWCLRILRQFWRTLNMYIISTFYWTSTRRSL